jgi:hypothetical protein
MDMDTEKPETKTNPNQTQAVSYDNVFTVEVLDCPADLIDGDPLQEDLRKEFMDAFVRVLMKHEGRKARLHTVPVVIATERIKLI